MSEVSLRAANRVYREHRSSDSIKALCDSVVKGQAEYGYTITHVYSFIDVNDEVQLFYCRDGQHMDLLTSPYVRRLKLLWQSGTFYSAPDYLERAYAELIRNEAEEIAATEARKVGFVAGNTGIAMFKQTIEVESESLEQAREQVKAQIPKGFSLLSEKIISDAKPATVKANADTQDEAFAKAQTELPANARILEKKVITTPERRSIVVEALDEQSAKSIAKLRIADFGITDGVVNLKMTAVGSKGFLGIRRKLNQYAADVFQPAVVEIVYKPSARIRAEVGIRIASVETLQLCMRPDNLFPNEQLKQAIHELKTEGKYGSQSLAQLIGELLDSRSSEIIWALLAACEAESTFELISVVRSVLSATPVRSGGQGRFTPEIVGGGKIGWTDGTFERVKAKASEALNILLHE